MNYAGVKGYIDSIGEYNACAPIAVSIATETPIDIVLKRYEYLGRKKRRTSKRWMTRQVVTELGFRLIDVPNSYRSKTVRTLEREINNFGTYLVFTRGHILCIKNGVVEDWTKNRCNRIIKIFGIKNGYFKNS